LGGRLKQVGKRFRRVAGRRLVCEKKRQHESRRRHAHPRAARAVVGGRRSWRQGHGAKEPGRRDSRVRGGSAEAIGTYAGGLEPQFISRGKEFGRALVVTNEIPRVRSWTRGAGPASHRSETREREQLPPWYRREAGKLEPPGIVPRTHSSMQVDGCCWHGQQSSSTRRENCLACKRVSCKTESAVFASSASPNNSPESVGPHSHGLG
jgi:hypothetical protein